MREDHVSGGMGGLRPRGETDVLVYMSVSSSSLCSSTSGQCVFLKSMFLYFGVLLECVLFCFPLAPPILQGVWSMSYGCPLLLQSPSIIATLLREHEG